MNDDKNNSTNQETNQPNDNDFIQEKQNEIEDLKNQYLRLQAEFANYKRRNQDLSETAFNNGTNLVLSKTIDVLDDFDLALSNKNCSYEDFKKGMELVYAKLFALGEEFNLKHIDCLGKQFDPKLHEVLLTEKSEKPENEVIEELQKGYIVNGNVLRHSKVKVSKR